MKAIKKRALLYAVIARSVATKQSIFFRLASVNCFAEPVIGARIRATRWLAMTEQTMAIQTP